MISLVVEGECVLCKCCCCCYGCLVEGIVEGSVV